jgi:hypothetical protein
MIINIVLKDTLLNFKLFQIKFLKG